VRRLSLASSVLLLLGVSPGGLGPGAPVEPGPRSGLLVTVGEVTPRTAALWLRADDEAPVTVRYGPADGSDVTRTATATPEPRRDLTARVVLDGLAPATRYAYRLEQGPATVAGEFGTAPEPDAHATVRLVWSGDLGGGGYCRDAEDGYRIFRAMAGRRPDLFLFVGDTIYADHVCGRRARARGTDFVATTLAGYHAKHRYNRADHQVQHFFRGVAVFPIWDDHEVRNDFEGPLEPLMPVGRQAFLDYWPVRGPDEEPGRLYRSVRWGRHVEIFILDTRQYRSSKHVRDGPGKTMLGDEQRAWLLSRLPASDATWKLVVSSVPLGIYTGGREADAWSSANLLGFPRLGGTGFAFERDTVLESLRRRGTRNLVFLTGEVHHAELIRHEPVPGWSFHEFAAGPLSARPGYPRPLDRSLRSTSLGSLGWALNFGEITADADTMTVRIIDAGGGVRVVLRLPAAPPREEART